MNTLTDKKKIELGTMFLAAWKNRDWPAMAALLTDDVVWSLPGESILSGEVQGPNAVTNRARQLKDFGIVVQLQHILLSQHGLALSIHNTAKRGDLLLDEYVVIVCMLRDGKISRLTTHLNDVPGINAFFVDGIID